jgi:hypothetical protein
MEIRVAFEVRVVAVDSSVHAGLDAVVVQVGLDCRAHGAGAEDVAELDAADEPDIVVGLDGDVIALMEK